MTAAGARAGGWGGRLLVLLLLACGTASVALGPDRSWDTQNYHLYAPWALLAGRQADILAAGLQGFHNPALDLPFALLLRSLNGHPWLVGFLMGLPAGLALWLVWRIAGRVQAGQAEGQAEGPWLPLLAMLGAAGGAVLRSQVGTAAGDVTSGVLVLAALLPALDAAAPDTAGRWRRAALAGLLCGLAIGLKPTNLAYAPALAACLALAPSATLRQRAMLLLACAASGIAGVLAGYGGWGWALWSAHGNPVFPYFQAALDPAWDGTAIGRDPRFLPAGLLDALARPFRWAVSAAPIATEERMRDPRLAAGLLALPVLLALRRAAEPMLLPLAGFFLMGFLLWSFLFGIYRYAFVLEAIAPILVLGVLAPLFRPARHRLPILAGLVALAAIATLPIASGRGVKAPRYLDLAWPELPRGAAVLVAAPPVAYAAAGLPREVPMASLYGLAEVGGRPFHDRLRALLAAGGPLYLLSPNAGDGWERLAPWALAAEPGSCRRLCSNWSPQGVGPLLCAVRREGMEPPAPPHWPAPSRLCEAAAGAGLAGAGRRGMGMEREARLDFGPGCTLAEIRLAAGPPPILDPPAGAGGASPGMLRVVPPPDGVVRLARPDAAGGPAIIAAATCFSR